MLISYRVGDGSNSLAQKNSNSVAFTDKTHCRSNEHGKAVMFPYRFLHISMYARSQVLQLLEIRIFESFVHNAEVSIAPVLLVLC